jgi:methionyl-tRNA synthetase
MPDAAAKILNQLGVDPAARDFTQLAGQARLANGQVISKPEPVFPRFIDEADTSDG